ncbi:MAG: sensor histidine kinase, partial [Limisphaerales bacterium]
TRNERMHLTGSLVRVRGVVGTVCSEKGQLAAFQIFAGALSDINILEEGPDDPFSQPLTSIQELPSHYTRRKPQTRVHLRGTVTLCWPGRGLFIQDSTGGVLVQTREATADLVPGSVVEVAGFTGPVLDAAVIEDALIRRFGNGALPQPPLISTDDLAHSRHNNELVQVEATLLEVSHVPSGGMVMALQSGDRLLTALWERADGREKVIQAQPGSRLRVTGVCHFESAALAPQSSVSLLLRSPKDVQLMAAPVVPLTGGTVIAIATAMLTGLGLVLALWHIGKQRRQTEHMLNLQVAMQTEMRQGEQQLRRSMEERERIGRDLHDDIIQSIYAVGLNLEDCRRVIRQSPEQAEGRVSSAINALNSTIRSVRGFLSGLEPKVLNGREFKTALKSLALTSGEGSTQFLIDVDPSAANRLSPTQATQLLHIAKEAMSNSLRHAGASSVNVSLQPANLGVRLEIRDDGAGFDPENVEGSGHGLRNMAARARELGADLEIISAKGRGCRILATVPQRTPNEHG